jgi:hypothetical protein
MSVNQRKVEIKYGKNVEIKKNGKIIEIHQYACDFDGNQVLVKKIRNEQ